MQSTTNVNRKHMSHADALYRKESKAIDGLLCIKCRGICTLDRRFQSLEIFFISGKVPNRFRDEILRF